MAGVWRLVRPSLVCGSIASLLLACGSDGSPAVSELGAESSGPPDVAAAEPLPAEPERAQRAAFVNSAQRCGECHADAVEQWEGSPHARSASSPAYLVERVRAREPASCERCHAPLAAWVPAGDPIAEEGVSCDACHAVRDVIVDGGTGRLELRLDDNVKYATLCDAQDHYFHRMGCSPLHGEARFCAGCHHLVREVAGEPLAIYSEFSEWSAGPANEEGADCQLCHMPERRGAVATGSPERDSLSHHGFLGSDDDLRARAIELSVRARGSGDELVLEVDVRNRRAGHPIPAGMPGRRIRVRAIAWNEGGEEQARAEREVGRVLVGDDGAETFHHDAARVLRDDRIAPRETRTFPLTLAAAEAGQIVIEVAWRELSDVLAARAGAVPREQILARASIAIGPPAPRRRVGRPRVERAEGRE